MRLALPLLLLAQLAAAAPRPLSPAAPEFPTGAAWLNAKPLTMSRLKGRRVALLAFVNTANINSARAFEALKAWHERYQLSGLMLIGVHTPDYGFQREPAHVRSALKRFGVRFPVVLDNDRLLWRAYANEGWPAVYLVDHKGRVVFDRLGEGGTRELEEEIRAALDRAGYDLPPPASLAERPARECGAMTPEVAASPRRGKAKSLKQSPKGRGTLLLAVRDGEVSYDGKWEAADGLRLDQRNADRKAFVSLIYRGAQGFATVGAPNPVPVYVQQDDLWLHAGNAGKDVEFDDDGRSFVTAAEPRLLHLVNNPTDAMHELKLSPAKPGAEVYGFATADRCLLTKLP